MDQIKSLYIHFPFCRHLCNYCDFYKKVPQSADEVRRFEKEFLENFETHENFLKTHNSSWGNLETLYIGGGTPSLWGQAGISFFKQFLKDKKLKLDTDCEFTLEANPSSMTLDDLYKWQELGVNRYSVGVQSLNSQFIKALDRIHSLKDSYDILKILKEQKANYSIDFMLGLPHSKKYERDIIEELKKALEFSPSHFSVYILTVHSNYKYLKFLPEEQWIQEEYLLVSEFLKEQGFGHYEVSNFSKPGFESKHNLSYWNAKSVAALGPSSTGFLQEEKLRYKWAPNKPKLELEQLTDEEFLMEKIYLQLRTAKGASFEKLCSFLGDNDAREKIESLKIFLEDNQYAKKGPSNRVILNSQGYLMMDSIMNECFKLTSNTRNIR
jgi:oxygen-independent coproporphyrinogen III oxidase